MSRGPHWQPSEDATLRACIREGMSAEETGKLIDRSRQSCIMRAYHLHLTIADKDKWLKQTKREGFDFTNVQAKGADAGNRVLELAQQSDPSRLALRRFSFQTEGER